VGASVEHGSITGGQVAQGTITGTNIAASTVTALNLVAGIVVAGIVDATTINTPTLIGSTILGYATEPRGPTAYGFEDGTTQGWTSPAFGAVTNSSAWASTGLLSLLLTAAGGGQPRASGPTGTIGIPVSHFDPISLRADIFCPAALPSVYIGVQFYDVTGAVLLQEVDGTDTAFAAGQQLTLELATNAPADGYAVIVFGDHHTDGSGALIYADNIVMSGNLSFSASDFGGIDSLGNTFQQGIQITGVNGLLEAFTVVDAWGLSVLSGLDGAGNITGQTVSASSDMYLQGQSMASSILPALPQGIVARTNIAAASLPAPAVATASEFFLYQIDFQAVAGRSYLMTIEPFAIVMSGAGKIRTRVYVTTDGTQPTAASPILAQADMNYPAATTNFTSATNTLSHPFDSGSGALWRFLVAVDSLSTGGGAPTMQVTPIQATGPGDDPSGAANARFTIFDMGQTIPNTGRVILSTTAGSGSTKNFTKSYTATASYSYQGSDGPAPSARINVGGSMYQGGNLFDTKTGRAKTWIVFNYTQIASDLSGATIDSVRLMMDNARTWFSTGMIVALGWDTKTVFSSTAADPTGAGIDIQEFNIVQGQGINVAISNAFATAFQSSSATSLVLYTSSNSLSYYGFFSGAAQISPPVLQIHYHK
jgi:hypothetical protein